MDPIRLLTVLLLVLATNGLITMVVGGICWSSVNSNGRCTDMLAEHMTREQCCQQFSDVSTAWSEEDLDSGSLFFLRVLGDGVPCQACRDSCEGVECGRGKKCVFRGSRPVCTCAPNCKDNKGRRMKGPVCGTDGRSYRNICRLRKRACRRKSPSLSVAYQGFCQSSCERIKCPAGKYCLVDQNLNPHCVRCSSRCGNSFTGARFVCGADGTTYRSTCALREAACLRGKAIPLAYKGRCRASADCGNVKCKERQSCLIDLSKEEGIAVRCVTCGSHGRCHDSNGLAGPICGNNNRTYPSWCHMMNDACATGYVIETRASGPCH